MLSVNRSCGWRFASNVNCVLSAKAQLGKSVAPSYVGDSSMAVCVAGSMRLATNTTLSR
jgi:hypothetical protein